MEQVTGNEKEGDLIYVTKKHFNFKLHTNTEKIIKTIPLESNSAVWAGLFLLESYTNKTNKLKSSTDFIGKPFDIDIYLFSTKESILSTATNIIDCLLTLVKYFGNLKLKIKKNIHSDKIDCIRLKFKKYLREINLWFSSVNTIGKLLDNFETSNEQIYWAHDTGLVSSPFAKIAFDTNQILPNPKNSNEISNQKIFEMELIGFNSIDYIKSVGFLSNNIPEIVVQETYSKWKTITSQEKLLKKISPEKLNNYIGLSNLFPVKKYTNFDNIKINYFYYSFQNIYINYDEQLGTNYSTIILNGHFEFLNKSLIECLFIIDDNDMAHQIKKIYKSLLNKNSELETNIIDTNFLSPEEKEFFKVSKNKFKYAGINKLGILCKLSFLNDLVDVTNKKQIISNEIAKLMKYPGVRYDFFDSKLIPLNKNLNMWTFFGKEYNTISTYVKLIIVK